MNHDNGGVKRSQLIIPVDETTPLQTSEDISPQDEDLLSPRVMPLHVFEHEHRFYSRLIEAVQVAAQKFIIKVENIDTAQMRTITKKAVETLRLSRFEELIGGESQDTAVWIQRSDLYNVISKATRKIRRLWDPSEKEFQTPTIMAIAAIEALDVEYTVTHGKRLRRRGRTQKKKRDQELFSLPFWSGVMVGINSEIKSAEDSVSK